jgi:hypothetical protein
MCFHTFVKGTTQSCLKISHFYLEVPSLYKMSLSTLNVLKLYYYNWSNPGITCALRMFVCRRYVFHFHTNQLKISHSLVCPIIWHHSPEPQCMLQLIFCRSLPEKIYIFRTRDNTADFIKRLRNARDFRLPPHVFEALTLPGCYAASVCKLLQTFRDSLSVYFKRIKNL